MEKRIYPCCQEKPLSRKTLMLQALLMPGIVCVCDKCKAIVSIKSSDNLFMSIAVEIIFFALLFASLFKFGHVFFGIILFIA